MYFYTHNIKEKDHEKFELIKKSLNDKQLQGIIGSRKSLMGGSSKKSLRTDRSNKSLMSHHSQYER